MKKSTVRQNQGYSSSPLAAEHSSNFFGGKGVRDLFSPLKAIVDNGPILTFVQMHQELCNQVSDEVGMAVGQTPCPGHHGAWGAGSAPEHHSFFKGTWWEMFWGSPGTRSALGPSKGTGDSCAGRG